MMQAFNLSGRAAVVTGGADGIGAACVRVLAQAGAAVMIADIREDAAHSLARELREQGFEARAMALDVSAETDWDRLVAALRDWKNRWDVLINNAGIYIGGRLEVNSLAEVQRIHEVNVASVFLGTRCAAAAMKPGGVFGNGGSIVNLSSIAGLIGVPGHSIYGATKGAVRAFTRHTAVEFARFGYGIRVNSLHPGLIETQMGGQALQDFVDIGVVETTDQARELLTGQMIPMGRLGSVDDVANAVLYLASDASSYVTGIELVVDGGFTAG